MNKKRIISYITGLAAAVLLIVLDQVTKYLAVLKLKDQASFPIIKDVFELHYLENQGAAFGLLQGKKVFFLVVTVLFILVLCWFYGRLPLNRRFRPIRILSAFLLAGAVGNMIDRVVHNYVIDFFYFKLIDFPIFNVADIYVTVSLAVLVILIFLYYKDEDFNAIFPEKKEKK